MKIAFLGGTGRCGTSITRKLLGSSNQVGKLKFEHRILIDPDGPIEFLDGLDHFRDPFKLDLALKRMIEHLENLNKSFFHEKFIDFFIDNSFLKNYFTISKYSGWKLSKTFPNYNIELNNFKSFIMNFSFSGRWVGTNSYSFKNRMYYFSYEDKEKFAAALNTFYCSIISDFLKKNGKEYFIEDSTWNINNINTLRYVFNDAKFIHIFRDPRDVIASFQKQRWMPNNINQLIMIYKHLINDILAKIGNNKNCYSLKFEDLVDKKDLELKKLCKFLDLPYCKQMKKFQLNHGNIGRYQHDFDSHTIKKLNIDLSSELDILGYVK